MCDLISKCRLGLNENELVVPERPKNGGQQFRFRDTACGKLP